ncbi:rab9 effector protein with kelch motifs [Aplysia californica]|uniref:Rab9 effector protein with kelch motifs n=1 Tax=Aplysia californica TaxID=6500 RepID=A0ABM0J9Z6_APLCA|nr:rab9 effector protein with kelch motifs [Aplysia californica]XP_005088866.1 rab9 effector protein with kelch motifs [Aplysia californica]XP_005088867.1 rab9 effector protein with kelch motifs [Aplysia californica]
MAMELHPFLEPDIRPAANWWYVVSAAGQNPTMRVGHSATYVPALQEGEHDRVFVIGGANPSQVFSEVYVLDLHTRAWDTLEAPGFRGRYEHSAFRVENHPGKIFVFGGATQEGNLNDLQSLDVSSGAWADVETSGEPPSPRTHRCATVVGSKVYVYSGGQSGPDPVSDRRVHCLDTHTMSWTTLTTRGDAPKPRHGHMMIPHNNRIYLHGGMAGATFYDDLHVLDLERSAWSNVRKKRSNPPPRAAHYAVVHSDAIYMFGGMSGAGALDDAYKLNTETNTWTKLDFEGPAPANRLDFALCVVKLQVPRASAVPAHAHGQEDDPSETSLKAREVLERELKPGSASSRDSVSDSSCVSEALFALEADPSAQGQQPSTETSGPVGDCGKVSAPLEGNTEEVTMVLVNGGMDTEGEIFDDTLVLLL